MGIGKVDDTRKVTISLGGSCRLRCSHCYITAPQFRFQRRQSVEDAVSFLESCRGSFDAICISGDTDPLLDQSRFCDLLVACSAKFVSSHLMFTTRLLPTPETTDTVMKVGSAVRKAGKLFLPAMSFVTHSYPNGFENETMVPHPDARIEVVSGFAAMGITVLVAMRPTLPFAIVSRAEVEALISRLAAGAAAILGEVFIVDENNVLAERLGLGPRTGTLEPMTFLEQPGLWRKWRFDDEIEFARTCALEHGVPYFLRSMSAVRHLEAAADGVTLSQGSEIPSVLGCYDDKNP